MIDSFYINNDLVEKDTNQYIECFNIKMPIKSRYSGYYFVCSSSFIEKKANCYMIFSYEKSNFIYELIKIEREQGKRYKRPKLNWQELQQEFQALQHELNPKYFPQALVLINDYEYSRGE